MDTHRRGTVFEKRDLKLLVFLSEPTHVVRSGVSRVTHNYRIKVEGVEDFGNEWGRGGVLRGRRS